MATNAKIQYNISEFMPAGPKKDWDMWCEYHYSLLSVTLIAADGLLESDHIENDLRVFVLLLFLP